MTYFHETALGQRFLEHTLPSAVRELGRLADQVGELTEVLRVREDKISLDHRCRLPRDIPLSTANDTSSPQPCLLLVDDDQLCRSGLARMLKPYFQVIHAGSAGEAITVLESTTVDTILTDFNMPGQDGLWLLEQVRSMQPDVRRVLMSGQEIPSAPELIEAGVLHAFVTKPAPREALIAALGLKKP